MSDYHKPRPTDPEYFAALGRLSRRSSLGHLAMLDALRGAIIGGAMLVGVGYLVLCWWLR